MKEEALYSSSPLSIYSKDDLNEVLGVIVEEVEFYGRNCVTIDLSTQEPCYSFSLSNGQTAAGSIDKCIRSGLMDFLSGASDPGNLILDLGASLVRDLSIQASGQSDCFTINWKSTSEESVQPVYSPITESLREIIRSAGEQRVTYFTKGKGKKCKSESLLKTALIVEDNPGFSNVLERFLKRQGISCQFARGGAEAIKILERSSRLPDLIISDVHMPEITGMELLHWIRSNQRTFVLPVIMLSSDDDVETKISLLSAGADAFVRKSEDPRILCAHTKQLLERAKSMGQQ